MLVDGRNALFKFLLGFEKLIDPRGQIAVLVGLDVLDFGGEPVADLLDLGEEVRDAAVADSSGRFGIATRRASPEMADRAMLRSISSSRVCVAETNSRNVPRCGLGIVSSRTPKASSARSNLTDTLSTSPRSDANLDNCISRFARCLPSFLSSANVGTRASSCLAASSAIHRYSRPGDRGASPRSLIGADAILPAARA